MQMQKLAGDGLTTARLTNSTTRHPLLATYILYTGDQEPTCLKRPLIIGD
jgi:hypothetical protein